MAPLPAWRGSENRESLQASAPAPCHASHARRDPALEGLRAIAISGVVLYHLRVSWLPGGNLGVVVFLVLMGYLVTSSLLREHARMGAISPLRFWARRLRRIWIPMATVVLVTTVACMLASHVLLTKLRPDVIPALGLFLNWSSIARGASYFGDIGGASPLAHLWYLALDAQFCLVWPLVVMLGMRVRPSRRVACMATIVLAAASAVLMAVLFDPASDPTRVYYGTDTRSFAPLLGACLAILWPVGARLHVDLPDSRSMDVVGLIALGLLVVSMVLVDDMSPLVYYGGMVLVCLLVIVVIASGMVSGGIVAKVLSARPLVWLGSRSFSLYLWHYPVIRLLDAAFVGAAWWKPLVAIAASLVVAECAYRLVERPLAQGRLGAVIADARQVGARRALSASPVAGWCASGHARSSSSPSWVASPFPTPIWFRPRPSRARVPPSMGPWMPSSRPRHGNRRSRRRRTRPRRPVGPMPP